MCSMNYKITWLDISLPTTDNFFHKLKRNFLLCKKLKQSTDNPATI